jgi:hypothetical protein
MMPAVGSVRLEGAAELEHELGRWHRLEEWLLVGLALTHHGYSVRLDFDHIWASDGVVRPDLAQTERRVTIEMHAVQRLHVEGGLSRAMLDHPGRIDWGLSEVAQVRAQPCDDGVQLRVLWEGERQIVIDAKWAEVTPPPA